MPTKEELMTVNAQLRSMIEIIENGVIKGYKKTIIDRDCEISAFKNDLVRCRKECQEYEQRLHVVETDLSDSANQIKVLVASANKSQQQLYAEQVRATAYLSVIKMLHEH